MSSRCAAVLSLLLAVPIWSLLAALPGDPFQPLDSLLCAPPAVDAQLKGIVGQSGSRVAWLLTADGQWLSTVVGDLLPGSDWQVQAIEQRQVHFEHPALDIACPTARNQQVLDLL